MILDLYKLLCKDLVLIDLIEGMEILDEYANLEIGDPSAHDLHCEPALLLLLLAFLALLVLLLAPFLLLDDHPAWLALYLPDLPPLLLPLGLLHRHLITVLFEDPSDLHHDRLDISILTEFDIDDFPNSLDEDLAVQFQRGERTEVFQHWVVHQGWVVLPQ